MEHLRRNTDATAADIERLITEEDDPKQRAFLIVLNSINNSLISNSEATREINSKLEFHLSKFDNHVVAEDGLINQGKGVWRVMSWVLGISQTAIIAMSSAVWVNVSHNTEQIHALQIVDAQLAGRVSAVERVTVDAKGSKP